MPEPERRLWRALRGHRFAGCGFRRQQPIGRYVVDFVCFEARLVVEIDGDSHGHDAGRGHDEARTRFLNAAGFRVIRFWNDEVMTNLDAALGRLKDELIAAGAGFADSPPLPVPPPRGGRGRIRRGPSTVVPSPLEGEGQGGGDPPHGTAPEDHSRDDRAAPHPPASNGTDR